jgi:hypothetical protein
MIFLPRIVPRLEGRTFPIQSGIGHYSQPRSFRVIDQDILRCDSDHRSVVAVGNLDA